MPTVATKPVLWELADVVEQIITIAATVNLTPTVDDYGAARCDFMAENRLSKTRVQDEMRSSLDAER